MRHKTRALVMTLILVGTLIVALGIRPAQPSPTTIVVPDDHPTIQGAINAANEGDTIFVRSGTYPESVTVNKSVALIGECRDATIIDGENAENGITIGVSADHVELRNFTIYSPTEGGPVSEWRWINLSATSNTLITDNDVINTSITVGLSANVTITGNYVKNYACISLRNSSSVLVAYNTMTNGTEWPAPACGPTISLRGSSNNTITQNNMTGTTGVVLWQSFNNTIAGNRIFAWGGQGVCLRGSSNNTVIGNNITGGPDPMYGGYAGRGIELDSYYGTSSGNTFSGNSIRNMGYAVYSYGYYEPFHDNVVSGNTIVNNTDGIFLEFSSGFILEDNSLSGNNYGLTVYGTDLPHYNHEIDSSNTVNGKPVYYLKNQQNLTINPSTFPSIGYLGLVNATNITVENLDLRENGQGLLMAMASNCYITHNNFAQNYDGIWAWYSSDNNLTCNTLSDSVIGIHMRVSWNNLVAYNSVTNNSQRGLALFYSFNNTLLANTVANSSVSSSSDAAIYLYQSYTNTIFHNNLVTNERQVFSSSSYNLWDNGCEGNYWSDYSGIDLDSDGVGDTALPWQGMDSCPLMNRYWNPGDVDHDLDVDIFDVVRAASAYGSTPSDPRWNPHCDIQEPYGVINIFDIVTMARSYGTSCPP